jgi:D-alanyl-D-alanine carboxypeptidase
MTTEEIKDIQRKIGVIPDGKWGKISNAACQKYLKDLMVKSGRSFPKPKTASFNEFWGPHGVAGGYTPPMKKITLPFTLYLYGDRNQPVHSLRPHEKAADAFLEAFEHLEAQYPTEEARNKAGITIYDGLYNPRLMRGSSTTWSMHSWAIALDLNAGPNGLHAHWPRKAVMPFEVYECFAKAGISSLGWSQNRDAMHAEAVGI